MVETERRPYEMRSGQEILEALDKASKGVEAAATELARLSQEFGEAHIDENGEIQMGLGLQFETALREKRAQIYEAAIAADRRPPPEDVREAMAQRGVREEDPALWVEYNAIQSRIAALRGWIGNQKAIISANQSIRKGESA
jgi:hypothetical protein